ncbi:MAG: glycosyltransferase family 2 protein [Candidatus Omnitrophica bacterium]|nr:glycosyltransferase family 2 protein [Candidatus Omnitrophota bacterium]MDD5774544.1 glycosyltransferase family 2 protein [Candidatus Omnitrophota bacterium]
MISCDIVLTVYNNTDVTRNCLESVVRHFRPGDRLNIIDNGSDAVTQAFLEEYVLSHRDLPIELIRFGDNRGYLKAANEGMRHSSKDAVCLLSNDTVVTAGWLDRMCGLIERNPRIGVVNPLSTTFGVYPEGGQTVEDVAAKLAQEQGQYSETAACVGFCMLIDREVISAIGYLDEAYGDGYFEDTDFCRRAIAAGFVCAIAKDAYVWHKEHSTFRSDEREALFRENRALFEQRWGKPRRLVYGAASKNMQAGAVVEECLNAARKGDWVWLVVPQNLKKLFSGALIHGNIRLVAVSRPWVRIYPWFLYVWKRKKPVDAVVIR